MICSEAGIDVIEVDEGADEEGGSGDEEPARLAIEFIRELNRDLAVPPMRELIRAEDLTLLGQKAEQNTSTPSNPRAADAAAFSAMFAREMDGPSRPA